MFRDHLTKKFFAYLLFLMILILGILAYKYGENGFFIENLVPELIGVCVELLVILKVFEVWQARDENRKRIKVERRLREFLIFFLNHTCKEFPRNCQPGRFYGSDFEKNQQTLAKLIDYINQNGLSESVVLTVQNYCRSERDIFNNLIPVSSELENDHFKSWVRIAYFINAVVTGEERTSHAMIKILENIMRFDKESHDKHLYVGAK
ncbi:hypothetical protein [Serratia marcescens]|uniref:hypothetical protein n=1 Tax=Serratia marcescens TaxID=615 RepID=UPI003F83A44F